VSTGFKGQILWDANKPDVTPKKQLDVSRLLGMGWQARLSLKEGVERTASDYAAGT